MKFLPRICVFCFLLPPWAPEIVSSASTQNAIVVLCELTKILFLSRPHGWLLQLANAAIPSSQVGLVRTLGHCASTQRARDFDVTSRTLGFQIF